MALDDTDDEVVTDPVTSPKESVSKIDNSKLDDDEKEKIESPPRSPDREKADLEKQVSLDMTNAEDLKLDDMSDDRSNDRFREKLELGYGDHPTKEENRRLVAFAWVVLVQLFQWIVICAGGAMSALLNGPMIYHDSVYISLTLLFALVFVGHLTYFSLRQSFESYSNSQNAEALARERYLNICKLLSLTCTMCGFTYALTGSFSQIVFNSIALSVALTLLGIFFCLKVFRIFPDVRVLLNSSLLGAVIALNIWGFSLCDQFGSSWRGTNPLSLVAAALGGFLLSAGILIESRSLSLDRAQQKIITHDYGCATILNVYTVFINTVWVKLVGEELFKQQ